MLAALLVLTAVVVIALVPAYSAESWVPWIRVQGTLILLMAGRYLR